MQIYINGQEQTWQAEQTVLAWLESQEMVGKRLAIEVNGVILRKSEFDQYTLKDQDRLEVIVAVGGG